MKRNIYKELIEWKNDNDRKPLIMQGARQVGKTYIIKKFAKNEYQNFVYFNFEEDKNLCEFFKTNLNYKKILGNLSVYSNKKIQELKTLIIFDEIQECPNALTALKYFNEAEENFHIIAAGSLLGIQLNTINSFPVGQVEFIDLYPLSFNEFLNGINKERFTELIQSVNRLEPINMVLHNELIELLKLYFFIGGMPSVINKYRSTNDFEKVRKIQNYLLIGYKKDFSKHTSKAESMKIMDIWNSIPNQLAKENKKFKYSDMKRNAKAREYAEYINWLSNAGIIYKSYNIKTPKLPLSGYIRDNIFKLFLMDIGLLGAMIDIPSRIMISGNKLFSEYNGAFTENYVAQELMASGHKYLYYWTSDVKAEVDFIIPFINNIYPLEVKSGICSKKKSLKIFGEKYNKSILSRATLMNFKHDGKINNYPLYAISKFPILS